MVGKQTVDAQSLSAIERRARHTRVDTEIFHERVHVLTTVRLLNTHTVTHSECYENLNQAYRKCRGFKIFSVHNLTQKRTEIEWT